jgi:hypothetical protein
LTSDGRLDIAAVRQMDAGQGALIGRFEPKVLSLFVGQKLGTFILWWVVSRSRK